MDLVMVIFSNNEPESKLHAWTCQLSTDVTQAHRQQKLFLNTSKAISRGEN